MLQFSLFYFLAFQVADEKTEGSEQSGAEFNLPFLLS
jgi:hypothetical protein